MKIGNKLEYINSIKSIVADKHEEIDALYEKMLSIIGIEKESSEADFLFDYIYNDFESPKCKEILKQFDTKE